MHRYKLLMQHSQNLFTAFRRKFGTANHGGRDCAVVVCVMTNFVASTFQGNNSALTFCVKYLVSILKPIASILWVRNPSPLVGDVLEY